ncbi:hypothetical protein JCM21714_243 [Gracilibacillus boraciitolerans JCM 21714]|uniref:DUF4227 domain-containing protein n=1 Tax=Gracilibacillus boraciitolerans JCM 21714 TaxID=1298598 RepID=W4VDK7_9BACI|nr:DUF4227 family protein [Gracilibacillus boraciitolerans]GAE91297.1 hypothetical protein JCM21714_243 [Gracilibacillus boraciitolerans JCM 21714]
MSSFIKISMEMIKFFIIFVLCTLLFFYVIKAVHSEYEKLDRYEYPQGNAVKVFQQEDQNVWERLSIFFRLGE